jgi:hypothetical protein
VKQLWYLDAALFLPGRKLIKTQGSHSNSYKPSSDSKENVHNKFVVTFAFILMAFFLLFGLATHVSMPTIAELYNIPRGALAQDN